MGKTVTINQDKLLMLKEALNEFMVDKSSNFVNHDAIFFILYRGDLLFFDEKNKKLLDNFFDRHYDELSDFIYEYNVKKFSVSSFYFSNFMDWIGARVPYLITGYISNQKDVYITANESYDVLNSNELYQLVKRLPNCNIYLGYKLVDKNKVLGNKGQSMPDFYYHGTVLKNVIDILKGGIKPNPEDSLYKIKHDKTVFITSSFEQAKWYANFSSSKRGIFEKWAIKPCVLKIDASKIDSNKIVYDYDVYNMHKAAKDDSIYNDRMKELNLSYKNSTYTIDDQDPRKFLKVGYRGIIMPNAIVSVYLVDYTNKNTEIPKDEFIEYAMKMRENVSENVELDKYEIGTDGDDSILGGDTYHVNESTNFDSSEIGAVNYSWDFDEEEYQEWLEDAEYENTQESLMEYINDNVEFELEYLDNETYHTCGTDYVDYNALEDMFGSKMQNEILTTCMNDGSGSFETVNLYSDDDVDVNNHDSVNNMAMKLLRHGDYFKDCRGFILTNGVVVYTESEHNEICRIPNINDKFDFIRMGNIRVLPQSIDIGDKPTSEQRDVLRRAIASYADEELYLDIYQGKNSIGAHYIRPDWRFVMGEIDRFYSEGVRPQGNEFYESKKSKKQIVENKYDNLFNKANYDLQHFLKQGKEKYGTPNWYISSWMEKTHPEINVDPKDIKTYIELSDKLHKITKLWNDEDNKEENEKGLEQPKENYDIISLAIEKYGVTSRLSQAGYILPDGKLLNFGSNGYRQTDHRNIEGVYKQNNIKIWDDEYRYNYVVDFMNHGAIRCDVNTGILDMTQEPTNEQFYVIRHFVRNAVDVDIDFTDDKGNTLHSVSYSDAKPQAVVADIMRYYEDGIKPMGNVQYENKNMNNSHLIIESQESKSIAAAKRLVMQRLNYNEQQADEFVRIKLRNDIPTLRTLQGGKFILGAARMFCDGELRTANDISNLNSTLKLVASDAHINEYDRNLNGLRFNDLIQRFAKAMSDNLEAEKAEVNQMTFDTPSDYEIVRIDSFGQARKYGKYTSWCITHQKDMFYSYTSNGINQFYFCLKNGFENVEAQPSEGCPLDEYGLSMIAVSVNENGMLSTCTCRWNHDNGGNDSIMNTKQISQVIGMNFFEVFKPNGKWSELIANVKQRLINGEDFDEVFDGCANFYGGLAKVELNRKWNFINKNGEFLSEQWLDYCYDFHEGFALVKLNNKYNFINKNGEFLSEQWFDYCCNFKKGFAIVELNKKYNFINNNGELLSNQWFDNCCNFDEGFAAVRLNNKWNFIDKNGKLISRQWFDDCGDFKEGFAAVELNNKCNFINKSGELLSEQWFDDCKDFNEGFARIRLDGRYYCIGKNGKIKSNESNMSRKNILVSESQLKAIKENFDFEVNSSDIDLSSFKKRHELVPNIWRPSGKLDSRIRLKLLDIADDFWQFVNITWVKPKGIILTGSICNFNWSQYSDIDLHLIVDFNEIDDKTEFVRDYLDAKKNEWNNEHDNLQIMGYKVELYDQDSSEEAESNGIYDLEADEWIKEPDKDDIEPIALNKYGIKDKAAKIMTIIDDMYDTLVSTDDSHIIEQIGEDASYLWKKIKEMRKNSLEKDGEMGSGNVVYKYLRRKFYLDKLWNLRTLCYDKSNSITESKKNSKKYTVYVNGKKDDTFSDMNWKRKPKVGKGFYCGGAVFKIKKVTDDSVYAIEESKFNNKEIIREYLEKNNNLPLYKYYKWAKTASSCEKARDLAYSCCYYIDEYIKSIYYRYSEFENLLDDGKFNYVDEEKIETFCKLLEENNLCDHFISIMQDIVNRIGLYNELPSWCHMDFNRIVKNEWCIHFTKDAGNIVKYGFTGGTEDIDHLAYTDAGQEKPSAGYNFAFLINDRNVDYNEYGDEAVIFRTSGVEIYHYGDNENQVIFWGPNVKNFIPIHQENGDWVVYGENGQVLVRKNEPSKIAIWATENLPQYRKQIMTGKNGYIPKHWVYDKESGKMKVVPYPIYKNESIKKYIKLLKENLINEETVADGSSEGNPYSKRWKAEREALKNFVCNYGTLMQSKEDDKSGRVYKVLYDKWISQLIGYNYALCVQWDEIKMKPKSIVYIRAMDRFTPNIRRNVQYDTRGRDNQVGTNDDISY